MNIYIIYVAILLLSAAILVILATRETPNDTGYCSALVVLMGILNYLMYLIYKPDLI